MAALKLHSLYFFRNYYQKQPIIKNKNKKKIDQMTKIIPSISKTIYMKSSDQIVKLKTLGMCKLGISRFPDFEYNAQGGSGTGTVMKKVSSNGDSSEDEEEEEGRFVEFNVATLYIPPLTTATTKFLGLPLPPFLKIDIAPELFRGNIDSVTGKVNLEFKSKFWFSVGTIYRAPPLTVATVLTTEESKGMIRKGKGKRMDETGRCKVVGVATIQPINDFFINSFLSLPTECLATLNAVISWEF